MGYSGLDIKGGNSSAYSLSVSVSGASSAINASYNSGQGQLSLNTASSGDVVTGGRLGVGMTPTNMLDVNGTIRGLNIITPGSMDCSSGIMYASAASITNNLNCSWWTATYCALQQYAYGGQITFAIGSSQTNQMMLTADINSGFTFWNTNSLGTTLYSRAVISTSGAYTQVSDCNIKTHVSYIDNDIALGKVNALQPCRYVFKEDPSSNVCSGLYAQDVQSILPEAVSMIGGGGSNESHLGIDYNSLIPHMISSIQCLSAKYDMLSNCYYVKM